jgi:hypothetical protein
MFEKKTKFVLEINNSFSFEGGQEKTGGKVRNNSKNNQKKKGTKKQKTEKN